MEGLALKTPPCPRNRSSPASRSPTTRSLRQPTHRLCRHQRSGPRPATMPMRGLRRFQAYDLFTAHEHPLPTPSGSPIIRADLWRKTGGSGAQKPWHDHLRRRLHPSVAGYALAFSAPSAIQTALCAAPRRSGARATGLAVCGQSPDPLIPTTGSGFHGRPNTRTGASDLR